MSLLQIKFQRYKTNNSLQYLLGCLLGSLIVFSSCGPKEVFLQSEEIKLMDSLFVSERQRWNRQLADTCDKIHSIHFDKLVDSLKEDRLMEIREILKTHE